ncbi:MAG TPA: cation:proton antiporter [Steroidobacteraceae bacterium]|nr:cation:proton antiporter [Steroidobacteraceae bacterium]
MSHSPLLLQLVVILGTARVLGLVLRYFGQPPVIGEMAAGIILGPVVFGAVAPELHAHVFEKGSIGALGSLSQLGLVLFMFIVGAELRMPSGARKQIAAASWIGFLSVLVPMVLGLLVAVPLHDRLAPAGVTFWPFALFMASAMSITAFPIMARILKERQMTHTTIGRLSLTSAAIADVLAWVMLALVVVLAGSGHDWGQFARTVGGLAALCLVLFLGIKPLLARLIARYASDGRPQGALLATLLIGTFACAYVTDSLQVHAVFGAFLFGACLPRDDRLLAALIERIEYVAILVLMPIFFALAGLNTTADAFGGAGLGALALILAAAVVGKIAGGAAGARIAGQPWSVSFAVGSLMNARALMELIVIKVGLDIGVIGNDLFTMLMVMAIVTTLMTGPLLTLCAGRKSAVTRDEVVE